MKVEEDESLRIKNSMVRVIVRAKFARNDNAHYRWWLACINLTG